MDARLILLPSHPDYSYPRISEGREEYNLCAEIFSPYLEDNVQLTRDKLREYMLVHSVKGKKKMPKRSPFVGDTKTFESPIDPDTKFVIRRLSVVQVMTYRDRNSVVRYVTEEESGRYTTERDYPAGTMNVDLAALGVASWNIQDMNGNEVKVNEDTIKSYLDPEELDFVADKVLEVNPILSNRGNQKSKTEAPSEPTTGSTDGGSDAPPVRQLLQDAANGTGSVPGDNVSAPLSPTLAGVSQTSQSILGSPILS